MEFLEDAATAYLGRHVNREGVLLIPPERGAEWAPRAFWQAPRPVDLRAPLAPPTEAVEAYVNHGRWIVECPDCHGAQLACRTDLRFMCDTCGNESVNGRWRPVIWPADGDQLEAELVKRPDPRNRNWNLNESLADIRAENEAMLHGVKGAGDGMD